MPMLRKIAALVMLLCIVLPQRACVYQFNTAEYYPLSDVEGPWILFVAACYALPIVFVVALRRWPITDAISGIVIALVGLWHQGYGALQTSSYVLVGWYLYVASTLVYLVTSVLLLRSTLRSSRIDDTTMTQTESA